MLPGDEWDYLVPISQPSQSWNQLGYNSSSWSTGISGFGYGDGDDATIISNTISIYIRKTFSITNLSDIEAIILDLDYDDGFVAYLNGQEVARNLISGAIPNFNQTSDGYHEALLPQGYAPERFGIDVNLLNSGTNVLAVQVHNQSFDSSDLSALPVFSVGINNTSSNYETPPYWFEVPYLSLIHI